MRKKATESSAIKGSLAYAINNLSGKSDWVTPEKIARMIFEDMNVNPLTDVCATKENTKCVLYITPEMDFFKTDVSTDCFMNPEYLAGNLKEGIRGIGHYVARLYYLHVYKNISTTVLLPSTATSTPWFQHYYGKRLINAYGEKAEPYFIPKRVRFKTGPENGSPPFSSQVFVHRRRPSLELKIIQQRYEEDKTKLMWFLDERKL